MTDEDAPAPEPEPDAPSDVVEHEGAEVDIEGMGNGDEGGDK